jgi:hypothetical protein
VIDQTSVIAPILPDRRRRLEPDRVCRGRRRTLRNVRKVLVERRLSDVAGRLHALREELRVIDEQFVQLNDEADDTRLRSLMSETPLADREFREAQRHADAMFRRRAEVVDAIERLEARQDELLDALNESRR